MPPAKQRSLVLPPLRQAQDLAGPDLLTGTSSQHTVGSPSALVEGQRIQSTRKRRISSARKPPNSQVTATAFTIANGYLPETRPVLEFVKSASVRFMPAHNNLAHTSSLITRGCGAICAFTERGVTR